VAGRLGELYPASRCSLDFRSPLELLLATILSAQCTDRRVNLVTPELFRRWPTAASLSAARQEEVEGVIRSTGFFRAKAKNLLGCCRALVERHGGEVPVTLAELVTLPGVGRKTANVVLGVGFGRAEGIVVDTHVGRICRRLDLTRRSDAVGADPYRAAAVPRQKNGFVTRDLRIAIRQYGLRLFGRAAITPTNYAGSFMPLFKASPQGNGERCLAGSAGGDDCDFQSQR
jgi:endonuclease-3